MRAELIPSESVDAPRTRGIGEVRALSGLRGFAALWVMVYHLWALSGTPRPVLTLGVVELDFTLPLSLGWAGVDIFFVLSAFLLALPFAEARAGLIAPVPLRDYFRRRALRILPAYYMQLLILLALAALFGVGRTLSPWEFFAHLFVLFHVTSPPVAPLLGVWYTLTPECMYYLVLPLAALWFRPRRWLGLLLLAVVTMLVFRAWVDTTFGAAPIGERVNLLAQLPARIDQFMLGSLAAYALVQGGLHAMRRAREEWIAVAALLVVVVLAIWLQREAQAYWHGAAIHYAWHGLFALAIAVLCVLAVRGSRVMGALFDNQVLAFLGRISFSLYLWHFPLFQWIAGAPWAKTLPGSPALHLLTLGVPAAIATAWLSWRCVERPFVRLAHGSKRLAPAQPSVV